eukprot:6220420-Amphidinium_carterae.1
METWIVRPECFVLCAFMYLCCVAWLHNAANLYLRHLESNSATSVLAATCGRKFTLRLRDARQLRLRAESTLVGVTSGLE